MRFFYSLLVMCSTPFVLLYFALRGLHDRDYLRRWNERFGLIPRSGKRGSILVHAASVGEFNAAAPLIKALHHRYPEIPLTVTTFTPTGSERVNGELGDMVFHCYVPLDLPGSVARFLGRLQPRMIIVMETEIWPNLYLQAQRLNIPLLMANARLSTRSARRFKHLPGFTGKILQTVDWMGAQSAADADHLTKCGANPQRMDMTGNLKFDLHISAGLEETGALLRSQLGRQRPVLVAGSTHEADEAVIIPAFVELLQTRPSALLILVPRHPERFTRAEQLAKAAGLKTELRSQAKVCSASAQCFVIDSIGELMTYYACGDIAFVGGSMGDEGGHNALEPAALGKPVLLGPNMNNARDIATQLLLSNAARQVTNQQDFLNSVEEILTDKGLRDSMGRAGKTLVEKNRGALDLTLEAIRTTLVNVAPRSPLH
jgi:3-deoxy-D-manno-octulosonic-acid transferase